MMCFFKNHFFILFNSGIIFSVIPGYPRLIPDIQMPPARGQRLWTSPIAIAFIQLRSVGPAGGLYFEAGVEEATNELVENKHRCGCF